MDATPENSDTPAQAPEAAPAPAPPAKGERIRKPKSPEAQARGIAARALARKAARLGKDADLETLRKAAEALETTKSAKDAAPAQPKRDAAPASSAAQAIVTAPAASSSRGPAWPSDAATSAWRPVVAQVVTAAAVLLHGSRYALDGAVVEVEVCGKKVSATKADALVDALSPLAAKYLPDNANTPEAYAGIVLFAVFGAPALGHGMEKLAAAIEKRAAA